MLLIYLSQKRLYLLVFLSLYTSNVRNSVGATEIGVGSFTRKTNYNIVGKTHIAGMIYCLGFLHKKRCITNQTT